MTRTRRLWAVRFAEETSKGKKPKSTNAERCAAYRKRQTQGPVLRLQMREADRERAWKNRQKPKTEEEKERQRALQRVPNHFVPIVLCTHTQAPVVGTFHLVQWNGTEYVGQVKEVDELLQVACVSFMSKRQRLYYWPSNCDYSWEPFGSFLREVSLNLDESKSSQRCQFFTVI